MVEGTIRIIDYKVRGCPVRTVCKFFGVDKHGNSTWLLDTKSDIYNNYHNYTSKYEDYLSHRHHKASIRRNFRLTMEHILIKTIDEYLSTVKGQLDLL
jgi:hypothetical protein